MKRALLFMNKGIPFSYILDLYPTAQIAYSFRKLRSAYSGNCIKVRRSSDNTTQDIGFVSNILDTASLLSFVGAGDGFIHTWFDQSGNANNQVQATNANQPQIIISGALITKGGKPALYAPTTVQILCTQYSNTSDSAFTVFQIETTGGDASKNIPFSTAAGSNYYGICTSVSGSNCYQGWGTPSIYKNGSASALTNTRGTMYTNFVTGAICLVTEISPTVSLSSFSRNYNYSSGFRGVSYAQEHISYSSNKTSDKTAIETNIKTYYGIV